VKKVLVLLMAALAGLSMVCAAEGLYGGADYLLTDGPMPVCFGYAGDVFHGELSMGNFLAPGTVGFEFGGSERSILGSSVEGGFGLPVEYGGSFYFDVDVLATWPVPTMDGLGGYIYSRLFILPDLDIGGLIGFEYNRLTTEIHPTLGVGFHFGVRPAPTWAASFLGR